MSGKLPYTLDFNKMGMAGLQLLDVNDTELTGPIARKRDHRTIQPNGQFPLLQGWSDHALRHRLIKPDFNVERWEQARWDQGDEYFLRQLPNCEAPEDADEVMPEKWKPHRTDVDSDPRLERVTKLCTTIVNRVVDWTSGNPNWAPKSVADWQRCEVLQKRIQDMLELLESALGESVGVPALKDPAFVKRCWRAMSEEDHSSFEDTIDLASRDAFTESERSSVDLQYDHRAGNQQLNR